MSVLVLLRFRLWLFVEEVVSTIGDTTYDCPILTNVLTCRVPACHCMYVCVVPFSQAGADVPSVTRLVSTIPGATLLSDVGTELSFQLPMQESSSFPEVFSQVCKWFAVAGVRRRVYAT